MKISFKGEYLGEFNGQPRLAEARLIKAKLGMLPMDFGEALNVGDPDALSMMVAIMLTRAGRPTEWDQVDGEYEDFETVLSAEEQKLVDEAMAAQGKDPVGKAERNVSPALDKPGSLGVEAEPPQTLTWTGPSPATPSDSGSTSDSPS
jgi:hypothetical protein